MLKKKDKKNLPTGPVDYPKGTFVQTEKGYFLIDSSRRYRIPTKRVLDSWSPHRVVESTEAAVKHYKIFAKLRFRNGSLIHNIADGKVYLIVDGKRCLMTSPEAYERIGAKRSREYVFSVSVDEINLHAQGEDIK